MFVPVEPAFQLAIQADPSLVKDALEQNIILVSPTTLLVALRTIDNLWRNERQNQNAQVIADKASNCMTSYACLLMICKILVVHRQSKSELSGSDEQTC